MATRPNHDDSKDIIHPLVKAQPMLLNISGWRTSGRKPSFPSSQQLLIEDWTCHSQWRRVLETTTVGFTKDAGRGPVCRGIIWVCIWPTCSNNAIACVYCSWRVYVCWYIWFNQMAGPDCPASYLYVWAEPYEGGPLGLARDCYSFCGCGYPEPVLNPMEKCWRRCVL